MMMCFDEKTGKFLWQLVVPKREDDPFCDWPKTGMCSAATVEGERAYASVLDYPGPIDEATLYVHADAGLQVLDEIAKKGIPVVWLNPGADEPEVVVRARTLGLNPRVACSILAIGDSPIRY